MQRNLALRPIPVQQLTHLLLPPHHPEWAPPAHHHHHCPHAPPRERAIPLGQATSSTRPLAQPRRKPVNWDLKNKMMNDTANQALELPTLPVYHKRTAPQHPQAPVRKPTTQPPDRTMPKTTHIPEPLLVGRSTECWADMMAPVVTLERPTIIQKLPMSQMTLSSRAAVIQACKNVLYFINSTIKKLLFIKYYTL